MFETCSVVAFIDDDEDLRRANLQTLELAGMEVRAFASAEAALREIDAGFPGVVVTDIRMPRMDGHQLFGRLHAADPELPVILITGHGDIDEAVAALRRGAYDFVAKPFAAERLIESVRRAQAARRLVLDNRRLRALAEEADDDLLLLGGAPVMERLRATLRHLAEADVDVLIEGETGAGKELAARALHRWSPRRLHPFVAVNAAALPEALAESELFGHELGVGGALRRRTGLIESADRGTLFLDEVESMPFAVQAKLLRVLEEREVAPLGGAPRHVDVRVLAATKVDLLEASRRREFREDLFHRLNVMRVRVPPLRERRDDIPLLFGRFLSDAAARFGRDAPPLTEAVRARLALHDWPGNVRELQHFAERVALGLDQEDAGAAASPSLPQRLEAYEAALIRQCLTENAGDVRAVVASLGIPRKTFYDKLQRHRIALDPYRAERPPKGRL